MIGAIDLFSGVPILRAKELPVKTDSCPEDLILRFCSTSDPSNFTNHSEKFNALGATYFAVKTCCGFYI